MEDERPSRNEERLAARRGSGEPSLALALELLVAMPSNANVLRLLLVERVDASPSGEAETARETSVEMRLPGEAFTVALFAKGELPPSLKAATRQALCISDLDLPPGVLAARNSS